MRVAVDHARQRLYFLRDDDKFGHQRRTSESKSRAKLRKMVSDLAVDYNGYLRAYFLRVSARHRDRDIADCDVNRGFRVSNCAGRGGRETFESASKSRSRKLTS